jgi:hypothetical protein
MDNVQNYNSYIAIPSSQTCRSYYCASLQKNGDYMDIWETHMMWRRGKEDNALRDRDRSSQQKGCGKKSFKTGKK